MDPLLLKNLINLTSKWLKILEIENFKKLFKISNILQC